MISGQESLLQFQAWKKEEAADAIIHGGPYSFASIPRFSFPSLLGLRKKG